jgi:hypothetical protein
MGFAVDVVSVSIEAAHESLDRTRRACDVSGEIGMAELEADVDARKFRTVKGVGGGSGSHQDFDVSIRGGMDCVPSKW